MRAAGYAASEPQGCAAWMERLDRTAGSLGGTADFMFQDVERPLQ
ncbi:hypothetical protein [Planotetraspora mira]|nr:hypothetical protein [Planotetraspora mira]